MNQHIEDSINSILAQLQKIRNMNEAGQLVGQTNEADMQSLLRRFDNELDEFIWS